MMGRSGIDPFDALRKLFNRMGDKRVHEYHYTPVVYSHEKENARRRYQIALGRLRAGIGKESVPR